MKRGAGFTLLELLVALAIFAVLALLAYGGLNGIMSTRSETETRAEALRTLQFVYRLMQRDIEQWVPRDIRNQFGETETALRAGEQVETLLEVTHGGWRNPAEQPRSTLQRVGYKLEENALIRLSWLTLDRSPDAQPREQKLLEGVREVELRFLTDGDNWLDRWPPLGASTGGAGGAGRGGAAARPRALEVTLDTELWGELRWLFRLPN